MNTEYLNTISSIVKFKLAIMGKDPYKLGANGIPFCKETWDEMKTETCSGKYVLESLGYDINELKQNKDYIQPAHFFNFLASEKKLFS